MELFNPWMFAEIGKDKQVTVMTQSASIKNVLKVQVVRPFVSKDYNQSANLF